MIFAMNLKPPGIVWLGQLFVPLSHLVGSIENALLLSVWLTQALLLWTIYKIGESIMPSSRLIPLGGVVFAAGTQAFVGLSSQFFVEPMQALAVAWTAFIAVKGREWPAARTLVHWANAMLLGMLAKISTPAYCWLFYIYIAYIVFRGLNKTGIVLEWAHKPSRLLICVFGLICPLTIIWYAVNWGPVLEHATYSSSGGVLGQTLLYGFRASVGKKMIVWMQLLNQSFLAPYVWVVGILLIAGMFGWKPRPDGTGLDPIKPAASVRDPMKPWASARGFLLTAAQILAVLLVFSMNDAIEARYLYAIVVYLAILLMMLCTFFRTPAVALLVIAVCGWQWANVHAVALGARTNFANQFNWLLPVHADRSEYEELARVVEKTSVNAGQYNIVGVEEAWLNANAAAFFAAKNRLNTGVRSYYTSLGYAETDSTTALKRIDTLNTFFVISLDQQHQMNPPNFLNVVSLPVLHAIQSESRFRQLPFPSGKGVLIFERPVSERK